MLSIHESPKLHGNGRTQVELWTNLSEGLKIIMKRLILWYCQLPTKLSENGIPLFQISLCWLLCMKYFFSFHYLKPQTLFLWLDPSRTLNKTLRELKYYHENINFVKLPTSHQIVRKWNTFASYFTELTALLKIYLFCCP